MTLSSSSSAGHWKLLLLCALVAALALSVWIVSSPDPQTQTNRLAFFYDVEHQEIVIADLTTSTQPSTGIVRATVFSCGDCADHASRFVGWVEKDDPSAADARNSVIPSVDDAGVKVARLADDGDPQWVARSASQLEAWRRQIAGQCGHNETPVACLPQ